VVHHGGHQRQQAVVRGLVDEVHMWAAPCLRLEAAPAARQHAAQACQRQGFDDLARQAGRVAPGHAAKTHVHRRRPGIEEGLQRRGGCQPGPAAGARSRWPRHAPASRPGAAAGHSLCACSSAPAGLGVVPQVHGGGAERQALLAPPTPHRPGAEARGQPVDRR
jgi:hypothetical protein